MHRSRVVIKAHELQEVTFIHFQFSKLRIKTEMKVVFVLILVSATAALDTVLQKPATR